MKAPSPPPPPDPYKTATAQQLANIEVAIASTALQNADEYRPDGQVTFEQIDPITVNTYQYDSSGNLTGTTPREVKRWKKVVALTPEGQTQFSQQQQISISMNRWALGQTQLLESLMAAPLNVNDLVPRNATPTLPVLDTSAPAPGALVESIGNTDLTAHVASVRDAIDSRLQYQLGVDRDLLIAKLAHQGIFAGAVAYVRALDTFDKASTDARIQAFLAAQKEQDRIISLEGAIGEFKNNAQRQKFDQAVIAIQLHNKGLMQQFSVAIELCGYVNTLRQVELQERITVRSQTVNEVTSLMHGGQISVPQFQPYKGAQLAETPVGEYVYRTAAYKLDAWKTKVAAQQSMFGGILGFAGNMMGGVMAMSDRRVKADISYLGTDARGIRWHLWRYLWDAPMVRRVGVIAQELREIMPEAVVELPGGVLAVDYGALA